jgi:hypothetical protein
MEVLRCRGSNCEYKWPTVTWWPRALPGVQYFLLASSVPLPRRSWIYSDPSGPYDRAYECAQMEANSATFFPPWFGLFRHKQARPRINKIKFQRNCKLRRVKQSSCFIARKQSTAQIYSIQVDDRLSAAHPKPLTMTHTKRNSLHRHAFVFSSNLQ